MNDRPVPPEFCSAPWKLLHVSPQGDVFSCYESVVPLGNVHERSLQEIWNGPEFVALRQKMRDGERVAACAKCHVKADAIAGRSLRTLVNEQTGGGPSGEAVFRGSGLQAPLAVEILDLSFSNNCNLKCRMCSSVYSRAWIDDETTAFGRARAGVRELSDTQLEHQIFPLLEGPLKKIVLAGGEPLLDRKNKKLLSRLIDIGRTDVALQYNTNGTMFDDETLALWTRFPTLRLSISVDSSGRRFEYLRKGAKWARLVDNVAKLRDRVPHASLACYSTISLYNVVTHPEFMREVLDAGIFSLDEMNLHYLVEPEHLSVRALPAGAKASLEASYYSFIQTELLAKHDFEIAKKAILQIKMLLNFMKSADVSSFGEFVGATEKMDEVRGESFRDVFPELAALA